MKSTFFALAAMTAAGSASASVSGYGQCGGGSNWTGETACASGFSCQKQNDWYSQCVPGTAAPTKAAATKAAPTKAASTKAASKPTPAKSSSAAPKATSTKAAAVKPAATPATVVKASSGGVQYAGVNVCKENHSHSFDETEY
jgi:pyruvate/2-oxoglutarate dehydrogenase complex dihydrolipoamide acyltransferase (E2) component